MGHRNGHNNYNKITIILYNVGPMSTLAQHCTNNIYFFIVIAKFSKAHTRSYH